MRKNYVMWLTESAIMVALATVLSLVAIIKMPFGGSVTAFSMVPIILVAYRYGTLKGIVTAFVYSIIQLLLGTGNLAYATSEWAAIAIIFLDYILAFTALGLSAIFKKEGRKNAMLYGTLLAVFIRFVMHFVSGCTVWAGLSIPSTDAMYYSLGYNLAYMLPELIVTLAGVYYLNNVLDISGTLIMRKKSGFKKVNIFGAASLGAAIFTALFDALKLFSFIQTEEGYKIENLATSSYTSVIIVTAVGCAAAIVFYLISKSKKAE